MNPEAQRLKQLGNDAYKEKDYDTALKKYGEAIELEPNEITYYNNTADVYFEMKNFDDCIKFCRKACKIGEENGTQSKFIFKGSGGTGSKLSVPGIKTSGRVRVFP